MNQYSWDVPDMIWIFGIFSSSGLQDPFWSNIYFDMLTLTPFGDAQNSLKKPGPSGHGQNDDDGSTGHMFCCGQHELRWNLEG